MAVSIRLKRMGRTKNPFYRVVIADDKDPRQGKLIDDIGYYDPMKEPAEVQINEEKALMWLKNGAQSTGTVRSILSKSGIMQKYHEQTQLQKKDETQETQ